MIHHPRSTFNEIDVDQPVSIVDEDDLASHLLPIQWPQPQNEEIFLAMEEAAFEEKREISLVDLVLIPERSLAFICPPNCFLHTAITMVVTIFEILKNIGLTTKKNKSLKPYQRVKIETLRCRFVFLNTTKVLNILLQHGYKIWKEMYGEDLDDLNVALYSEWK
ncbi:hypothetical protein HID58_017112 [Brassica napus]|uniref:Uncharacterized protein n=1 Tax=Brassica napus TaxID=3708 RepID=A0ABQ8D654_BRANA|nr:hypothetical protein HID58_017112 [Brassica napus]